MTERQNEITNLLLCGVGGQGVLLASELLSAVALAEGMDVKKSEIHGMAQRGGSVVSHVRFGPEVKSPLISQNEAHGILSFEYVESARYLNYLQPGGWIISNSQKIIPLTANFGEIKYPQDVEKELRKRAEEVEWIDAFSMAKELGNKNVVNVIIMGLLSHRLPFAAKSWTDLMESKVPAKFRELNLKAFAKGREVGQR